MTASDPLLAEDAFFDALVKADAGQLDSILAEDFLIIDVMRGDVTDRGGFLTAVAGGHLSFTQVEPAGRQVRRYGPTAIITGRTRMRGTAGGAEFTAASRYTHVFIDAGAAGWKLASAQGTPIPG